MKNKNAFTLIELLVAVLIIGILVAVALPQYQKSVAKSRFMQIKLAAEQIAQAEEIYYLSTGEYTDNMDKLDVNMPERVGKTLYLVNLSQQNGLVTTVWEHIAAGQNISYVIYFKHNPLTSYANRHECALQTNAPEYLHQICKETSENGRTPSYTDGTRTIYYWVKKS